MPTPDVRVRLSAEGEEQVVAALRKVQAEAQKAGKSATANFMQLNGVLRGARTLAGQLGAALGAGVLLNFTRQALAAAEETGNFAQEIGASVENLSALSFAARGANLDIGLLRAGLTAFIRSTGEIEDTSSAAAGALRDLGLSASDLRGKDTVEQLAVVLEALGQLRDSADKTRLSLALFGRQGLRFVPLANEVAEQGFGAIREEAERLGLVLRGDIVAEVDRLGRELGNLNAAAQQLVTVFVAALGPDAVSVVRSLTITLAGMAPVLETLGRNAAFFINIWKIQLPGVILLFEGLRAAIVLTQAALSTLIEATRAAARGDFQAAGKAISDGAKKAGEDIASSVARFQAATRELFTKTRAEIPGVTGADPELQLLKAFQQRREVIQSALDNELKLIQLQLKLRTEAEQAEFEDGLQNLHQYYDDRAAIVNAAAGAEILRLTKLRALELGNPDERRRAIEVARIDAELKRVAVEREAELAAVERERLTKSRELAEQLIDLERRILVAQGQRHAAAMLHVDQEIAEFERLRAAQGVSPDEIRAESESRRAVLESRLQAEELLGQVGLELNRLATERAGIELQVRQGKLGEVEAEERIAALEEARIPRLRAILEAARSAALISGDVELIDRIDEAISHLGELGVTTAALGFQIRNAIQFGLADTLAAVGDQIRTLEDLWRSFALTVLSSLQRIASERLAESIIGALIGVLPGFRRGGEVGRFAGGGQISGPGTGTSDSVPIMASTGEYVVRASAVARPGALAFLEQMNRGAVQLPKYSTEDWASIHRGSQPVRFITPDVYTRRYFAEGGLVGADAGGLAPAAAAGSMPSGTLTVEMGEGLIGRYLGTRAGERDIVRVVARNARAVRRGLGIG